MMPLIVIIIITTTATSGAVNGGGLIIIIVLYVCTCLEDRIVENKLHGGGGGGGGDVACVWMLWRIFMAHLVLPQVDVRVTCKSGVVFYVRRKSSLVFGKYLWSRLFGESIRCRGLREA